MEVTNRQMAATMKLKSFCISFLKAFTYIYRFCLVRYQKDNSKMDTNKGFSDDIIFEILLHLPVESLVRLRCVCKSWRNMIKSNEFFVRSHLSRTIDSGHVEEVLFYSNNTLSGGQVEACLQNYDTSATDDQRKKSRKSMRLPNPLYLGERFHVAGCRDGVICYYKYNTSSIYLWNPALHQCRTLPSKTTYWNIYFSDFVGFGYDPQNKDYKVVVFSFARTIKADIYSLKSNSWKSFSVNSCNGPTSDRGLVPCNPPLSFRGSLHWIGQVGEHKKRANDCRIVVFDIADEKFNLFKIPGSISYNIRSVACLGVFGGCLSFVSTPNYIEWDVWSMKTYGVSESWTRFKVIRQDIPIGFSATNGNLILLSEPRTIFSYDLDKNRRSRLFELIGNRSRFDYYFVGEYAESLVSIWSPPSTSTLSRPAASSEDRYNTLFVRFISVLGVYLISLILFWFLK